MIGDLVIITDSLTHSVSSISSSAALVGQQHQCISKINKINDYTGDDIDYECDDEDEEENGELVCSTAAGRLIGSS